MRQPTDDDRIAASILAKGFASTFRGGTIETLELADLSKHKHGDRVLCPCCRFPATLDTEGFDINFEDSCWVSNGKWGCVLMTMK